MWVVVNDGSRAFNGNSLTKLYWEREAYDVGKYRVFAEIVYTGEVVLIDVFDDECCAYELVTRLIKSLSDESISYPFEVDFISEGILDRHSEHEKKKDSTE